MAALDRLDETGNPLPLVRRLTPRMMAATALLVIALLGGTYYLTRRVLEPPKQHDPVSVVIADFENRTNDPAFDRTLEPMLKRALEGAGFISAYDRSAISRTLGVPAAEKLDEMAARELAVKQGLGVVLSGSLDRQGSGYGISVKATQTVTGNVIASARGRASSKEQVLEAATRLVTTVRKALGDEASESAQMFAMASLSATSLDVVRHYAAAQEAASNGKFDEALQRASKAVELDPKFGVGYQLLAVASRNQGKLQDAEKYINEALRYLDGMTERERYTTRGYLFRVTGDYQQCVKEYGELIARYAADVVGHNQLALCSTQLRDMRRAVEEMRQVVDILPNRAIFRDNLALYRELRGRFPDRGTRGANDPRAGRLCAAGPGVRPAGTGSVASGDGDLSESSATVECAGRVLRGVRSRRPGGARGPFLGGRANSRAGCGPGSDGQEPRSRRREVRGARARGALARTEARRDRGRRESAGEQQGREDPLPGGTIFVEAGEIARARPLMTGLAAELQAEPQAYAKIVEGEIALKNGDPRQAIKVLTRGERSAGHLDRPLRSRARVSGSRRRSRRPIPSSTAASSVAARRCRCSSTRTPPTAICRPSIITRVASGKRLKNAGVCRIVPQYLKFRGTSSEDPLLPEVRRRAGSR